MASSFGFGTAPAGVMGPSMANSGFFSQPQTGGGGFGGAGGGMLLGGLAGGLLGNFVGKKLFNEKGGIIPATSSVKSISPIHNYAKGGAFSTEEDKIFSGIATEPMMGSGRDGSSVVFGENAPHQYEAVVPLPDNKSIPVTFPRGMGGGGGGEASVPTKHDINLQIGLHAPMVNASEFRTSKQEVIQFVKADLDGDGDLRTTVKEVLR
jgi:hypothetical protein